MAKVLYISVVSNQVSGGSAGLERNLSLIKNVPDIDLLVYQVPMQGKIGALRSLFFGGNLILSKKDEIKILNLLKSEHFDYVFQEGTTSGHLAEALTKAGANLIVFAHNVETILYKERFEKNRYNIIEALKFLLVKRNEKKSVKYCSKLISLTKRDSETIKSLFGREADYLIPVSFKTAEIETKVTEIKEKYCLFVGSNFFPNIEGVSWFISNVAPFINMKLKVVGSCCKALSPNTKNENVELLGIVEDLDSLYLDAQLVVVPLFKGSGMKTKTIEAMSYGKSIFGTDECFQGIECNFDKIGGLCNTAHEFVEKINSYNGGPFNEYTKSLFDRYYSNESVQEKFNKIFK